MLNCCAIRLWYKDDAYDRVRWPYNLNEWDQHQKMLMLMVAMMIHQFHGLKKNLQADPCAPQDCLWKGLNCSYPNDDSPRITSLFVWVFELAINILSSLDYYFNQKFVYEWLNFNQKFIYVWIDQGFCSLSYQFQNAYISVSIWSNLTIVVKYPTYEIMLEWNWLTVFNHSFMDFSNNTLT